MRIQSLSIAVILAAVATSSVGCSDTNQNSGVVVGTTTVVVLDDTAVLQWEAGIFWSIANTFDPLVVGGVVIDPTAAVDAIATNINTVIGPAGCTNTSRGGDFVTIRFARCFPPFGPPNSTGALGVGVSSGNGGVVISAHSSTVKAAESNLSLNSTALYTGSGASRTLTVSSATTGNGPRGVTSTRSGTYTVTWNVGDTCANIDGSAASAVDNNDVMSFSAFRVCRTGCPLSGTVTRIDPTNGVTTTTTYDGTASVRFTTSDGQSGVETIACP